jgi:hypothetical protein
MSQSKMRLTEKKELKFHPKGLKDPPKDHPKDQPKGLPKEHRKDLHKDHQRDHHNDPLKKYLKFLQRVPQAKILKTQKVH